MLADELRPGYSLGSNCSLVVVDADDQDAIVVVDELIQRTCVGLAVPMVQTQRGPNGRHYYFRATHTTNLKSGAKLVIDGSATNVDVRAGSNGEGVGCVLAPPTSVTGGGWYELIGTLGIHEVREMPGQLAFILRGTHQEGPLEVRYVPGGQRPKGYQ